MRTARCAVLLLVLGSGISARADVPAVQIECWTDGGRYAKWRPPGTDNGNGTYRYAGEYYDPNQEWSLDWTLDVKPDPWINAVYGLTNMTGVTQNYTLIVTLPVSPAITPSSLIGGSTGGAVTDANASGAATAATVSPYPLFAGTVDGVTALPIYPHPGSWSALFQGGTANIPNLNPGLPGPTLPGPAVLTEIGIVHHFSLTAGDTIALSSFFIATPEPASAFLLALGALALRRR